MTNLQWIQFYEFGKPPMTDIVERLREPGNFEEGPFLMAEAADEIERLQRAHEQWRRDYREACAEIERLRLKVPDRDKLLAEIERLRAALQSLTKDPPPSLAREPDTDAEVIIKMREIARRALTSPTIARPAGR